MSAPRIHIDLPLLPDSELAIFAAATRHLQVLRVRSGDALVLFDGRGGEWDARVTTIGRREVRVHVGAWRDVNRELPWQVTLALGMPANERMDALVEKASELGAARVQPLECERSVLRLSGERAERRRIHWQGVAIAAAEQCGRTRVPVIEPVRRFDAWLAALSPEATRRSRIVLSADGASTLPDALAAAPPMALIFLSGPEGGLAPLEERAAIERAFEACTLGPRVLRADTAPLAALAQLMTLHAPTP